jgi:hypothetical protein
VIEVGSCWRSAVSVTSPTTGWSEGASGRFVSCRWLLALTGDGPARVTLEAAVPAAACEGEAWAAMASAWTLEAVRAALRSVA